MANQSIEARELQLFLMNDSDLYRQQWTPIIKNLVRKKKKGIYNEVGATALFMYLVKSGAKKYAKEYGDGKEWNKMFSTSARLEVARSMTKDFEDEYKSGDYNDILKR